jgi:hypothetical protein
LGSRKMRANLVRHLPFTATLVSMIL